MKILLLTDGIAPFVIGGMQKHSFLLTKYLAKTGVEVELHHCVYDNEALPDISIAFSSEELKFIKAFAYHFPKKGKIPGHYIRNSYRYSKMLFETVKDRLNQFDFIYTKGFTGWKLMNEKQKGLGMPKVGVKFHGMNMFLPTYGLKQKVEQYLLRPPAKFMMQQADVVFSYGGKVTETIMQVGISKDKIVEIPTGIESHWLRNEITPTEKKLKFIFIGRYDVVKGIRELNRALNNLKSDFEFHFVGPFAEHQKLKQPGIYYHGAISDPEKMKLLLDTMDILVLPSYSEGMPNVILEAMARGLAILATDVGAVRLLVDEKNGDLIESFNVSEIKRSLTSFCDMFPINVDAKKLSSLNKINANFQWPIIIQKFMFEFNKSKS